MSSVKESNSQFEDYKVNIRVKLSALWTSVTLCYLYGDYFELYVPQKTQGLLTGENLLNSPAKLLTASILLAIPAFMVFLSVVLKPALNRQLNIVLGLLYTIIMVLIAANSLSAWRAFYLFLAIAESCITAIIVYYAWKWKKTASLTT